MRKASGTTVTGATSRGARAPPITGKRPTARRTNPAPSAPPPAMGRPRVLRRDLSILD